MTLIRSESQAHHIEYCSVPSYSSYSIPAYAYPFARIPLERTVELGDQGGGTIVAGLDDGYCVLSD